MQPNRSTSMATAVGMVFLTLAGTSQLPAQRLMIPAGSVIMVRTSSPLESGTAKAGQTFETVVTDTVRVDDFTAIPANSRIRGVITFAQPADRRRSGIIEVHFDQLMLPDGNSYPLNAKLTSTDATERRQIETNPNARVLLVGSRGGIGAAIAGSSSTQSPVNGLLAALGDAFSEGRDVSLGAGTPLAVQLVQGLSVGRRGIARGPDASTIYTAADRIRAAQQGLADRNYYRGAINGRLDDATQRALFQFQIDKGLVATGNLDGRTVQALGIASAGSIGTPILSADDASAVRRGAQGLVVRLRQDMGISTTGRLDPQRSYGQADVDLWFALSAFADNAALYEQLVRTSANTDGSGLGGRALIAAAKRVDDALGRTRSSIEIQNGWASLRSRFAVLDPAYR
jgi:hypothetical protein